MAFQLVCVQCDSVGVMIEALELAPASTPVRCSHCQSVRGTLSELRDLAEEPGAIVLDALAPVAESVGASCSTPEKDGGRTNNGLVPFVSGEGI
jgi:hypothetical protein